MKVRALLERLDSTRFGERLFFCVLGAAIAHGRWVYVVAAVGLFAWSAHIKSSRVRQRLAQ